MNSTFLTQDEIFEMTDTRQGAAQCKRLQKLGIKYRVKPWNNKPLVYREDIPLTKTNRKTLKQDKPFELPLDRIEEINNRSKRRSKK